MKTEKKGPLGVLILAAGQGTRMHSSLPKVLHRIGGRPMIYYTLRLAAALKPAAIGIVVGHEADAVRKAIAESLEEWGINRPVTFIHQKSLTGSGAAVLESLPFLKKFKTALVTAGDTPLLTFDTLHAVLKQHAEQKSQFTMLSARMRDPPGYGRIVRSPLG